MAKRVCIVGTAPSYKLTPWTDPTMEIWSLNNAYEVSGFVRADRWFDFHPLDKFYVVKTGEPVYPHQIPPGHHVRPKTHLQWLSEQTIPVYLHPDYLTQCPEAKDWKSARPMPVEALRARFGDYWMSGPSWMVAMAVAEGVEELWITGIHLSTEGEYIRQRPNFEMWLGMFLGTAPRTLTIKNGLRYYAAGSKTLVLPVASPILQGPAVYPFEPHPDGFLEPLKWEAHKVGVKIRREMQTLTTAPWWSVRARKQARENLVYLEAMQADVQEQIQRAAHARGGMV